MKKYNAYSTDDFVQDLRFREWVRHPTPEEDLHWAQWLEANPQMRPIVDEARAIILAIRPVGTPNISDAEIENELQFVLQQIEEEDDKHRQGHFSRWLKIAACIAVLVLSGWFGWRQFSGDADRAPIALQDYMIEQVNKNEKPLLINLPDNSSVLLSQNSLVRYPKEFKEGSRNIYLSGDAFFEVTKDPDKPFYVETGKIIAKVLGTSFEINTIKDDQTRIIVRSGRVSVYSGADAKKDLHAGQPDIILGKNDQLIVKNDLSNLQRTQLNSSSPETKQMPDTFMEFKSTSLSEVFHDLSIAYGVKIDHSGAMIENCSVTASFTDEPFKLKLDLICRSVGIDYQVMNDAVIVTGQGCKTN